MTEARAVRATRARKTEQENTPKTRVENDQRQVGGDHYKRHGSMQPFNIIDHYQLGFYDGNALKYLLRYKDTENVRDLEKARHYVERMIDQAKLEEEATE